MNAAARLDFWKLTRRVTLGLLLVWLAVNLLLPWFAFELNAYQLFGLPAGYWLAAQGALLLYLLLIVVYVVVMNRLEERLLREEERAGDEAAEPGPGAT